MVNLKLFSIGDSWLSLKEVVLKVVQVGLVD